jgi:transcriptional regulator with XRE-family HTH domain
MNTLTPFGKLLRTMRLDRSETMKEMVDQLEAGAGYKITPAYLSAVELGRKTPNPELVEAVSKTYKLDAKRKTELDTAVEQSLSVVRLRPSTLESRALVARFARTFERLDPNEHAQLMRFLAPKDGARKK